MQQFSTQYILKSWLIIAIGIIVSTVSLACPGKALQVSEQIRLNQLGFYPAEEKQAILACENVTGNFYIRDMKTGKIVYTGEISESRKSPFSDKTTFLLSFSEISDPGEYGDQSAKDEFFWVPTELYVTTGDDKYLEVINKFIPNNYTLPVWSNVYGLGCQTLIRHAEAMTGKGRGLVEEMREQLLVYTDKVVSIIGLSSYASNEIAING